MANKKLRIAVAGVLVAAGAAAHAQVVPIPIRPTYQFPGPAPATGAAAVQMGDTPVYFSPYIGLAVGRDDNLFQSSVNEVDSMLYIVSPGVRLDARSPTTVFSFGYQGQIGRYVDSHDDDYVDQPGHG